ncbi:DUF7322 domain-containing protein [Natrinema salaciae]|uniref:DUF7322 domain-containing protein n=1 Tax=Natrinema salaciae TaxID=1186196 RepID=A0A1H9GS65_9EURY|nr:hypothetical protein [Natrinema salaciae]SEQ52921.1 hypothetical protein SAMN04489841_1978 [Natrinema salaciae]
MVFDRTENEPEEWDPEAEFYDPESDGLTIPQVSPGDDGPDDDLGDLSNAIEPSTAETDVPADVLQTFWVTVLVLNAAVLFVSLGLLLLIFEGRLTHSAILVAAGVALFGLAGRRYREFRRDEDTEPEHDIDEQDDTDFDANDAASRSTDPAETTSEDGHQ